MNLVELLFGNQKVKGKIIVEVDEKIEKADTEIEGNLPSVLSMLSLICSNLHEYGIPKELIKGAVAIGLNEDKEKEQKVIKKTIVVDSKEKGKELKELLKKLGMEE
jgi:hypothetical protein